MLTPEEREATIRRIRSLQEIVKVVRQEEVRLSEEISRLSGEVGWNQSAFESASAASRKKSEKVLASDRNPR